MKLSFKLWIKNLFVGRGCDHVFGYLNHEYVECEKCGKVKKDFMLAAKFSVAKWLDDIEAEAKLFLLQSKFN